MSKFRVAAALVNSIDENTDPSAHLAHDRLKSTGNLKSAVNITGAMNVPPKRAAFGDLSNVSKAVVDTTGKDLGKIRQAVLVPRGQKPADRENQIDAAAAVASQKGVNTAAGAKRFSNAQASAALALGMPKAIITNSSIVNKQGVSKKATTVYHDQISATQGPSVLGGMSSIADKQAKNPRHYKSQPYLRAQQPVLRRTQSKQLGGFAKIHDVEDDLTEAVYEDAVEQLPEHVEMPREDPVLPADELLNLATQDDGETRFYPASDKDQSVAPAALDQEEYWDDEDDQDQDLYDDPGFTTAHSYRSHGDNTTGGPTTMIAPRVTNNMKKELELAKAYVLEHQSEEEVEEEAWDVSMVAEYGDEIFEYMRDLEVSFVIVSPTPLAVA